MNASGYGGQYAVTSPYAPQPVQGNPYSQGNFQGQNPYGMGLNGPTGGGQKSTGQVPKPGGDAGPNPYGGQLNYGGQPTQAGAPPQWQQPPQNFGGGRGQGNYPIQQPNNNFGGGGQIQNPYGGGQQNQNPYGHGQPTQPTYGFNPNYGNPNQANAPPQYQQPPVNMGGGRGQGGYPIQQPNNFGGNPYGNQGANQQYNPQPQNPYGNQNAGGGGYPYNNPYGNGSQYAQPSPGAPQMWNSGMKY